jgi:hypothetical protein
VFLVVALLPLITGLMARRRAADAPDRQTKELL